MSDQMPGLRGQHDSRWLTSETRIPQFRFLRQCCLQVTWSGINAKTYSEEETKPTQKKKRNIGVFTLCTVIIQYVIFSVNSPVCPACIFGVFHDQMF